MNHQNQTPASLASYDHTGIRELKHISQDVNKSIAEVRTSMYGNHAVFPTKWPRLNRNLIGGLQPGKMYVIAGRPGVGKSLSNQMIFDVLDQNSSKSGFCTGRSRCRVAQQILRAGSKDTKMQTFELLSVDNASVRRSSNLRGYGTEVQEYPIYFCSIPQDMERVKKINEDVFIRYPGTTVINLIDHSCCEGKADTELQRLNVLSKACMWMHARMSCITILLSQLNRNVEQGSVQRINISLLTDLFGGDSIGQDARVVMMLQRPYDRMGLLTSIAVKNQKDSCSPCGKNRDGLGMIHSKLIYQHLQSMSELTLRNR